MDNPQCKPGVYFPLKPQNRFAERTTKLPLAGLTAMPQKGVRQDAGDHGFNNRDGTNSDARVMATLGAKFDLLATFIDRATGR